MKSTQDIKKIGILVFVIFQLFILLVVNLKCTYEGYFGFYYENKEYQKHKVHEFVEQTIQLPGVKHYLAYTGMETGYGFFAPNVASNFLVVLTKRNEKCEVIGQKSLPVFKNKESLIRYITLFGLFLEKLEKKELENVVFNRILTVILKQIGENMNGAEFIDDYESDVTLYLYHYPYIDQYNQGVREKLIEVQKI